MFSLEYSNTVLKDVKVLHKTHQLATGSETLFNIRVAKQYQQYQSPVRKKVDGAEPIWALRVNESTMLSFHILQKFTPELHFKVLPTTHNFRILHLM